MQNFFFFTRKMSWPTNSRSRTEITAHKRGENMRRERNPIQREETAENLISHFTIWFYNNLKQLTMIDDSKVSLIALSLAWRGNEGWIQHTKPKISWPWKSLPTTPITVEPFLSLPTNCKTDLSNITTKYVTF